MKASLKFFFILVAFCFTLGCQSKQEKKEAFFHSADKYYAQKEYKKAEIELKNAIKIDPQYVQANYLLAETMVKLGNLKGENKLAKKSLSRALELSNDFEGHEEAKQLINELNE
jgi:Tfp pilus assembly protein PilF